MQMIKTSNKKNPWTARVTLPADPLTGKRLKVGASGRTRREASEALEAKLRAAGERLGWWPENTVARAQAAQWCPPRDSPARSRGRDIGARRDQG